MNNLRWLIGLLGLMGLIGPDSAPWVVAGFHLIVAELEILMGIVILPPRHVERCAKGEVSLQGVVLNGNIGNGSPAVVAGDIGTIKQQVGLDSQQFFALENLVLQWCHLVLQGVLNDGIWFLL